MALKSQIIKPDLALAWFMMSIEPYKFDAQTTQTLERTFAMALFQSIGRVLDEPPKQGEDEKFCRQIMRGWHNREDEVREAAIRLMQEMEEEDE